MKKEYTQVTCCHCKKSAEYDKPEQPLYWFCFNQIHLSKSGSRPYEWWFCSAECVQHLPEIVNQSIKDDGATEIPARKEITEVTCDVCERSSKSDALNRVIGGGPFIGWTTVHTQHSMVDRMDDPNLRSDRHICSKECFRKFLLKDSAAT